MSPDLYTLPNTVSNWLVARYPDGRWWIFPGVAGGYASGHEWHPAPAMSRHIINAHNGVEFIYHTTGWGAWEREWLGVTEAWPHHEADNGRAMT